jgi:hypothetical protein
LVRGAQMRKWAGYKNMGSLGSFHKDERGREFRQASICVSRAVNSPWSHNLIA